MNYINLYYVYAKWEKIYKKYFLIRKRIRIYMFSIILLSETEYIITICILITCLMTSIYILFFKDVSEDDDDDIDLW